MVSPLARPRRVRLTRAEREYMVLIKTWDVCLERNGKTYLRDLISLFILFFLFPDSRSSLSSITETLWG